jgi:ERCC4-type nuclease
MPHRQPNPVFPATVLIDQREQLPYTFADIPADAEAGGGVWQVPTQAARLDAGDYSLDGHATRIAVERKSLADLFGTVGQGRVRFIAELERLNEFPFAAVVIEADWSAIVNDPPRFSRLSPRTVYRSVIAWQQRYPRVHWWTVPDREWAEVTTFRIFERFLKEQAEMNFRKPKVVKG